MGRSWIVVIVVAAACGDDSNVPPDAALPASTLTLDVLSSRPDMVTGEDALVSVRYPASAASDQIHVTVGDRDVTSAFGVQGDKLVGLVDQLPLGDSSIAAALPGEAAAELTVTAYPIAGPMISGPHQTPFVCKTLENGLGAPLDADCSVETRYEYWYKNTSNQFVALADPTVVPADVAKVTPPMKAEMNYIVRVERGTINRAIYQISALYDPAAPEWTALAPQPQWTGKALYGFRGGCGEGHHQGALTATDDLTGAMFPLADGPLAVGMVVMSSSLNTFGTTCNDVIAAETAMMVKERMIERYGVPLYTMGWGGSGGSIQQHTLAENYPGILDGIVPWISYPDVASLYPDIMDCGLLLHYYNGAGTGLFDATAQAAVNGHAVAGTCSNWLSLASHLEDPNVGCDASVPAGTRCTWAENIVNLIGTDATGHARKVYDNTGIQYGYAALLAGTITKDQFLDLNEKIGGFGTDGAMVAQRSAADPIAIRALYEGGRVVHGNLGLARTPIVDWRYYTDDTGDFHDRIRSFSTRDRLVRANGNANNQIMFASVNDPTAAVNTAVGAYVTMDLWLTALVADTRADRVEAVAATKPAVTDLCWLVPGEKTTIAGTCEAQLPLHSTPRIVAGAPRANDILECTLKPIVPADYPGFAAADFTRLAAIFPNGVCDWSVTGVEQVAAKGTFLSFGPHP
jgi:hypothetical protein